MASYINGVRYEGNNITVSGNKVMVDGVQVSTGNSLEVKITVEGNDAKIKVDSGTVIVHGHAHSVETMSGSVKIEGSVAGSVETMSGSVTVENTVVGDVKTMSGKITRRNIS